MKMGDKVICINSLGTKCLIKDKIYVIDEIILGCVILEGISMEIEYHDNIRPIGYLPDRFKVVYNSNFGEKICNWILKEIKEDEILQNI